MISAHLTTFYGLEVKAYDPEEGITDPDCAYRITANEEADDTFTGFLERFCADPNVSKVKAFIIGDWGEAHEYSAQDAVDPIIAARDKLSGLEALFIGDITVEECEISWIKQTEMEPVLNAFPGLKELRVRGMDGLELGALKHDHLETLAVECGGLPPNVLSEVCNAQLPALKHLELWLGTDDYGWESEVSDLDPILSGTLFPQLRFLGLCNSCIADEVAKAVVAAPILAQLETLDLSLGNLSDDGAAALSASPGVAGLKKLDVHHHYVSDEGVAALQALGIEVDTRDRREADEYGGEVYRYVAVGE